MYCRHIVHCLTYSSIIANKLYLTKSKKEKITQTKYVVQYDDVIFQRVYDEDVSQEETTQEEKNPDDQVCCNKIVQSIVCRMRVARGNQLTVWPVCKQILYFLLKDEENWEDFTFFLGKNDNLNICNAYS